MEYYLLNYAPYTGEILLCVYNRINNKAKYRIFRTTEKWSSTGSDVWKPTRQRQPEITMSQYHKISRERAILELTYL